MNTMIFARAARTAVLCIAVLAALPGTARAQEGPGFLDSLQGGPFVGATSSGNGHSFLEYGARLRTRTGESFMDLRASVIHTRPTIPCNPASPLCRVHTIVEALAGVDRTFGHGPLTPTLGIRGGVARIPAPLDDRSKYWLVGGPHLSLGVPVLRQVDLRTEAGALVYLQYGQLPGLRAYLSVGPQISR